MLLPLAEIAMRQLLQRGIPGAGPFTLNLTLWVGLLGAAIGAREGKLLTLATGEFLPKGTINVAHVVSGFAGAAIAMMFAVGGLALVQSEKEAGTIVAVDVPVWIELIVARAAVQAMARRARELPIGLALEVARRLFQPVPLASSHADGPVRVKQARQALAQLGIVLGRAGAMTEHAPRAIEIVAGRVALREAARPPLLGGAWHEVRMALAAHLRAPLGVEPRGVDDGRRGLVRTSSDTPQRVALAPDVLGARPVTGFAGDPELDGAALEAMGHDVRYVEKTSGVQAIERTRTGWFGGADPRREGTARGDTGRTQ